MVEITVSHENFEALMNAHTNENICVKHKNLKGEVWLNKRYNNIPTPSPDKEEAESIKNNSNKEYYNYLEKCANTGEIPVDNEVFMYEISI